MSSKSRKCRSRQSGNRYSLPIVPVLPGPGDSPAPDAAKAKNLIDASSQMSVSELADLERRCLVRSYAVDNLKLCSLDANVVKRRGSSLYKSVSVQCALVCRLRILMTVLASHIVRASTPEQFAGVVFDKPKS